MLIIIRKHIKFNNFIFEYFVIKSFSCITKTLNIKDIFLSFNAMARENIKYVVIAFQSTALKIP